MKKALPLLFVAFFFSEKISAQLSATITSGDPGCANHNGFASVAASGGSAYTYKWSNGSTNSSITNLPAGTYTVTVYSSGGTQWDTIYTENFDGSLTWTLNIATGTNDQDNNYWAIGGGQNAGGAAVGACASTSSTDQSLHITSVSQAFPGATYDAGSQGGCSILPGLLFCTTTNMAAQSTDINTSGVTNLVLQYDFLGNGSGLIDNASSFYSEDGGANFLSLDPSLKSTNCGQGVGSWTQRSYPLPSSSNNLSNFKIRFNWTNDDDAVGSDPSVAINNILLLDSIPLPGDSVVETVTLTEPTGPHFVTAALSIVNPICGQSNGSINNVGVGGGTSPYTLTWTVSGAQIGSGNSLTNIGAGTYVFEVIDQNGCAIDTSFILTTSGNGDSVTVSTTKPVICSSESTQICVTTAHDSYLWNRGDTTQCITVTLAGNYYVTVTDNPNCSATSNRLAISVYPVPSISISVKGDTLRAYNALSYQWVFNGIAIIGADDSVYIAQQSGDYSVIITDTNGCEATSNDVAVIVSGIDEIFSEAFSIFPNPVTDVLQITGLEVGEVISVYDISGRKIHEQLISATKFSISVSGFSAGVYFLKTKEMVRKFVVAAF